MKPRATKCCYLRCEAWNMSAVKKCTLRKTIKVSLKLLSSIYLRLKTLYLRECQRMGKCRQRGNTKKFSSCIQPLFKSEITLILPKVFYKAQTIFQSLSIDKHSCLFIEGMRFKHISEQLLVALPAAWNTGNYWQQAPNQSSRHLNYPPGTGIKQAVEV